jgi:hypothetical protein
MIAIFCANNNNNTATLLAGYRVKDKQCGYVGSPSPKTSCRRNPKSGVDAESTDFNFIGLQKEFSLKTLLLNVGTLKIKFRVSL